MEIEVKMYGLKTTASCYYQIYGEIFQVLTATLINMSDSHPLTSIQAPLPPSLIA